MKDENLEHYIKQSRLRSLRRKRRVQRGDFEKKLIGLHREQLALQRQIFDLGFEPLDPPVQRDWKRSFVLRADVARNKDAPFFQRILDKINTTEYSWRKDFKRKKRRKGKKIYEIRLQALKILWPNTFAKSEFTEQEKKFFELRLIHGPHLSRLEYAYIFTEPWRFTLRVQPNIITKTPRKDFDLERRKREIDDYLTRKNLYGRMDRLVHGRHHYRLRKVYNVIEKYVDRFKNKPLHEILNEEHDPDQSLVLTKTPDSPGFFNCHNGRKALSPHCVTHPIRRLLVMLQSFYFSRDASTWLA
jgi:hypothetical protein